MFQAVLTAIAGIWLISSGFCAGWDDPPENGATGEFWKLHWYEPGTANGNPGFNSRFRVNSPEASITPWIAARPEARANGMMLIKAEENSLSVTQAELYLELWGGHPGTANKRVTVNGRSTYFMPRTGVEDGHCAYEYPALLLLPSDLVNGYNAFQFAVDQGNTFWGHCIVDNACLRLGLARSHPQAAQAGLEEFDAAVVAEPHINKEQFRLSLTFPQAVQDQIQSVTYQAWHYGYDENGNGLWQDWHGFTMAREPAAWVGRSSQPPFEATWDYTMLPAQSNVAVRALVAFKQPTNMVFMTAATGGLVIPRSTSTNVRIFTARDLPVPFWSRAGKMRASHIELELDPSSIEAAELHVVTWTGGAGTIRDYFQLNGVHYPVAEGNEHQLVYSRMEVQPKNLRRGPNRVELTSDTEHHGIEIFLPGPALVVRYRPPD